MIKLEENKTRKKLRITMCILYILEIVFCSLPFINGVNSSGEFNSCTVLDMLSYLGSDIPNTADGEAFKTYIWFFFLFLVIPIVGFLFCAFDKQRNLKNLVSALCCLSGVVSIITIISGLISIGAVLALLVYLLIGFLTTLAMFARVTDK